MRNTPYRLFALAALLAALPFAGTRAVSAATVCVNTHGTNGCFTSINAAITAATAGDTIRIAKGRYVENVVVTKPVTLAGAGDDSVIVPAVSNPDCTGGSLCSGAASNIVLVQANNVTIHDLTLNGDNPNITSGIVKDHADLDATNGIITNHLIGVFTNLTVYNVTVRNVFLRGIYASSGGTFNFHDNCVSNVQGNGASIAMFNFEGSGRFVRNNVSKSNDAISSNWSKGVQFLDNEISQSGSGVHTDNAGGAGGGTGDLIRGNRVSDGMPGSYGIFVFVPYVPVLVTNNDVSGVDIGLSAFGGAYPPASTVPSTFADNEVTGRRTAGSVGVLVTTDTFQPPVDGSYTSVATVVRHNKVTDFESGVMIQSDATHAVSVNATCNAIARYTARGVIAGGPGAGPDYPGVPSAGGGTQNLAFSQNTITGKLVGMANVGTGVIDAKNNYWGCKTGPNTPGCGSTTTLVDIFPFLTKAPACAPAIDGKGKGDK